MKCKYCNLKNMDENHVKQCKEKLEQLENEIKLQRMYIYFEKCQRDKYNEYVNKTIQLYNEMIKLCDENKLDYPIDN